ncbi:MAG: hypothetical protein LBT55_01370 [Clostridiaceae bacterium]|nr:hypothetical protein [Clostridiaceae bacterium]
MKKVFAIIFDILFHLAGFPLLILLVYLNSKVGIEADYDFLHGYVGVIVAGAFWVIAIVVEFFLRLRAHKTIPAGKSSFKKQAIKLAIVPICCLFGLMFLVDFVGPKPISSATSSTLYYEDFLADYNNRHEINRGLLDTFIDINVENGHLREKFTAKEIEIPNKYYMKSDANPTGYEPSKNFYGDIDIARIEWIKEHVSAETIEEIKAAYKKEGFSNAEVTALAKTTYNSIDSAYQRFPGLGIDMAMAGNMSSQVIGILINPLYYPTTDFVVKDPDYMYKYDILEMLGEVPEGVDLGGLSIDGLVRNKEKGALDYMSNAWFNSVGLLGIITGLFAARELFYIFAGAIIVLTILRGFCREAYTDYDKKARKKNKQAATPDSVWPTEPEAAPEIAAY